ncbi:MAG: 30S ribosomal protein S6 [Planctomycetota bacterium]|nr:30S ribosomal protein S6 [Planctomycetota bacterium]
MAKQKSFAYEGMFLFGQAAGAELDRLVSHLNDLLARAEADLIAMKKWDERRLAYEIRKNKRGIYILAYFNADPTRIAGLERDCNLSEDILRFMIIRADHLTLEEMQSADDRQALADEAALRRERADSNEPEPVGAAVGSSDDSDEEDSDED